MGLKVNKDKFTPEKNDNLYIYQKVPVFGNMV